MNNNILKSVSIIFFLCFISTGCSVNMAASGKMKPNLSQVKIGDNRDDVIAKLGRPAVTNETENGRQDLFRFKSGGVRYLRAFVYAVLDVGTFGLWELIGTPMEEFYLDQSSVTVMYDTDQTVKDIETLSEY